MPINDVCERSLESRTAIAARAWGWTIAESVVMMLAIASLIATAVNFVGADWLVQRLDDARWIQR